jgi:hypothetical protein
MAWPAGAARERVAGAATRRGAAPDGGRLLPGRQAAPSAPRRSAGARHRGRSERPLPGVEVAVEGGWLSCACESVRSEGARARRTSSHGCEQTCRATAMWEGKAVWLHRGHRAAQPARSRTGPGAAVGSRPGCRRSRSCRLHPPRRGLRRRGIPLRGFERHAPPQRVERTGERETRVEHFVETVGRWHGGGPGSHGGDGDSGLRPGSG